MYTYTLLYLEPVLPLIWDFTPQQKESTTPMKVIWSGSGLHRDLTCLQLGLGDQNNGVFAVYRGLYYPVIEVYTYKKPLFKKRQPMNQSRISWFMSRERISNQRCPTMQDISRAYSVLHILMGSSVIAGLEKTSGFGNSVRATATAEICRESCVPLIWLGSDFKDVLFSILVRNMPQFDTYFSILPKPPIKVYI